MDEYEAMMQVSFYSIVEILKAFIPAMQKQKYGRILFMLSAYTTIPDPKYAAPYVASKYALLGLKKSVSAEYAAKGITVNGISPQMIETKFLKEVPELIVEQDKSVSPLGRLQKEDILPTMKLLLSDEATAITYENISITGKLYFMMRKIAFHLNCLEQGGAERVVTNLANQFADKGYEVIIATEWYGENEFQIDQKSDVFMSV